MLSQQLAPTPTREAICSDTHQRGYLIQRHERPHRPLYPYSQQFIKKNRCDGIGQDIGHPSR